MNAPRSRARPEAAPERRAPILATIVLLHLLALAALAWHRSPSVAPILSPPTVVGRLVAAPVPVTAAAAAQAQRQRPVPPLAPPTPHSPPTTRPAPTRQETKAVQAVASPPLTGATAAPAVERHADTAPVVPPRVDASGLDNPVPVYPAASRRLGEQGQVLLDVHILADGSIGDIRLRRSSGYDRLDNAALAAVRHWHYRPAHRGDEAIAFWYIQPIAFALDS